MSAPTTPPTTPPTSTPKLRENMSVSEHVPSQFRGGWGRGRGRMLVMLALAAMVAVVVASCGTSGRELREPDPNLVSPTRPTEAPRGTGAASPPPSAAPGVFALLTNAWSAGDTQIPKQYTCDGDDISPDLTWSSVPAGTTELALVVTDPDADGFVHWVVTGMPAAAGSAQRGSAPAGGTELTNSNGTNGWFGPCPPKGSSHTYDFSLLALDKTVTIDPGTDPKAAVEQLRTAASSVAVLSGSYQR
jgi:Raf kinase inhibitor-like YbhB/YbcL family protein